MKRFALVVLAGMASLSTIPAHAANVASLGCVRTQLGASYFTDASDRIFQALSAGTTLPPPPLEPLDKAIATCAVSNGWSDAAKQTARSLTLASIVIDGVQRILASEKVSVATIKQIYAGLDEPTRRGFTNPDTMRASSNAAAAAVIAAKVDTSGNRGPHIGMLLGSLAATEFGTAQFAAA